MDESPKRKIIVADDEDGIRDVFAMIIESNFDHEILQCASAAEAIEAIRSNGGVDLIFSDYNMGADNGGDLYKFLKDKSLDIPFVLCSTYAPNEIEGFESFDSDNPNNTYFQKPFSSEQIIDHINKVFDDELGTQDINTFVRVRPERFMRVNSVKETFNVYIRLSKKKYVKIINEGESDNFDVIDKYIKKGIDFIYLEFQKYEIFENSALVTLFEKIDSFTEETDFDEQSGVLLDSIESIQGFVKTLGVNERTIELIDKVVESTEKTLQKSGKLEDLLTLLKTREGYLKDHSYLTSFLACAIADRMSRKTEGIWKKIITASLFQNISLEHEEEAKIYSMDSKEFNAMDERVQSRIKSHPQDSVKMLSEAENYFSEDTRKMIQNHHERPDGKGFPRGLDATKVAPLEALFIISSNFADALLKQEDVNQVSIVAQDYNEVYNKGNYKKPYQGFLKAFIKLKLPTD